MEETYLLNYPGVKKKILAGGNGPMPHFPPGTKLVFHFQTLLDNFERTVIDDSRKAKAKVPMEIFVGKMFKMEVWETLLTSMRIGEVAEFWCDAVHTGLYPIVSKGMRLIAQGKDPLEGQRHTCGMGNMFHYNTTGWPELDELMRTPQALIFIMELIQVTICYNILAQREYTCTSGYIPSPLEVGDPFSYKRESWIMDKDEKMKEVPSLHLQGNALVRQGHFREAAKKYQEAVVLLRIVLSKEMPGDEDYIAVDRLITPLVLNYCQCMLELEEYYEVLEHTSDLIHKHKDCVKAYYKRAKAHAAVWNEKEAKRDFNMVANLDITLAPLVHKELSAPSVIEGMDWQQKLRHIMFLEKEGTFLLTEQKHSEATTKFKEALEYVDFIQNKVNRREDWDSLEKVRVPITLNLSQCLLELRDYQEVVALNTKLLKKHRDNFKAVYQRARAHSALCNEVEARNDFQKVERLEPRFKPIVNQEMKRLGENLRNKHIIDKKNYWEATEEKWGLEGTKTKARKVKKTVKFQEEKKVEGSVQKEGEAGKTVKEGGSDGVREEKKPEGKGEEGSVKSAEKAAIAEKEGGSGGVEKDSGKKRVSIEVERGGQAGLVNRAGDKETDMAQTNEGRDNVATERSGKDKAVKKGKCHLTAAQEVTKGSTGNKGTNESTRSKAIQSESTNRSPLATADLPNPQATEVLSEVAEERVGLDTQINRPNKGEAGESKMNEGSKSEVKSSDEQLCSSEGASHTKSAVSTGNPSFKSKPLQGDRTDN
ncbi:unnamed protein product [Oncorhynchus mykiss]|uniref:AIP/AIPL N-terminal FKBP-type PPIase domain-containing protein n=1 Tax=Oncorhynchus mykiss TaxID=8022 RepID=A0A060WRN7_ONCMY|nr:unnamed protein product [Oncorhynchus mykiss]